MNNLRQFYLGPKYYGYKVINDEGKTFTKIKVKGFALNYTNAAHINLKRMKNQVSKFVKDKTAEKIGTVGHMIKRTKDHRIITVTCKKDLSVVYRKRVPLKNFETLPFGY